MAVFRIKLAGIPMGVETVFDSTMDFCKEYLTEEAPLFSVAITQADIDEVRMRDEKNVVGGGKIPSSYKDEYLEKLALAFVVLNRLVEYCVLLFHGSVMAVNGKAYLFTAKSGTGKTTHCNLWLKNFPNSYILNGDKPLLLFRDNKVFVCGSPWMGKEEYGVNEILPLEALCFLERDLTNNISKIELKDCFGMLLHQCNIPTENGALFSVLKLLNQLENVNLYRLGCNMEDEAAFVSYNAMVK